MGHDGGMGRPVPPAQDRPGPSPRRRRLEARWAALAVGLGLDDGALAERDELLDAYGEAHRHHHTQAHLEAVLVALDELHSPAPPPPASRAAAWYHDAVYDPRRADNEAASADLARRRLEARGVAAGLVDRVAALVLATATHEAPAGLPGAGELLDADLSVLAAAPDGYEAYVAGVRAEYAHLDDATFRAGRAAVLRSLLERHPLFRTARGSARFEGPARANLAAELTRLGHPAGP